MLAQDSILTNGKSDGGRKQYAGTTSRVAAACTGWWSDGKIPQRGYPGRARGSSRGRGADSECDHGSRLGWSH